MIQTLTAPLTAIGAAVLALLREAGAITIFAARGVASGVTPPVFGSQLARQILKIGYLSLPVVGLTALFTGAALALNIYAGGARFNAEAFVPNIVGIGITRELGPVIAALMLAGFVSSAIAAEIGTMRVSEQIDALQTLSTDPFRYLIGPRLVAALITTPLLVLVADVIGIMGGFLVSVQTLGFNPATYVRNTLDFITTGDVMSGVIKGAVFGFIVALMGCYHGFNSRGGAQGVGRATKNAVASAMILILASNFVLSTVLLNT